MDTLSYTLQPGTPAHQSVLWSEAACNIDRAGWRVNADKRDVRLFYERWSGIARLPMSPPQSTRRAQTVCVGNAAVVQRLSARRSVVADARDALASMPTAQNPDAEV